MPPYLPDLEVIPMAPVASTHCLGVSVKDDSPDSYLNLPNSVGLKLGLCNCSHKPRKSIVERFLSQWLMTPGDGYRVSFFSLNSVLLSLFKKIVPGRDCRARFFNNL